MVRRQRAQQSGVNEAWTQQGDALEARQAQLGASSSEGAALYTRQAGEARQRETAKMEADKARQRAADEATGRFNHAVLTKMREAWSQQDARHGRSGGVGAFNPFKEGTQGFGGEFNPFSFDRGYGAPNADQRAMMGRDAFFGLEDNQRLAQMARSQGLNSEADRFQSSATYDFAGKRIKGGY